MYDLKNLKTIGERINAARTKRELTQESVAKSVGVSNATISRIENGSEEIDIKTLVKIANTLNVSVGELLKISTVSANVDEFISFFCEILTSDEDAFFRKENLYYNDLIEPLNDDFLILKMSSQSINLLKDIAKANQYCKHLKDINSNKKFIKEEYSDSLRKAVQKYKRSGINPSGKNVKIKLTSRYYLMSEAELENFINKSFEEKKKLKELKDFFNLCKESY